MNYSPKNIAGAAIICSAIASRKRINGNAEFASICAYDLGYRSGVVGVGPSVEWGLALLAFENSRQYCAWDHERWALAHAMLMNGEVP